MVARQVFRSGLRGRAKEWFQDLTEVDRSWDDLKEALLIRFKEADPALESILMSEAHTFQREKGESINDYIKREQRLYHRLRGDGHIGSSPLPWGSRYNFSLGCGVPTQVWLSI